MTRPVGRVPRPPARSWPGWCRSWATWRCSSWSIWSVSNVRGCASRWSVCHMRSQLCAYRRNTVGGARVCVATLGELKRRSRLQEDRTVQQKKQAKGSGGGGDEDDIVGGAAAIDSIAEDVAAVAEESLVTGGMSLLSQFAPLVCTICTSPAAYPDTDLRVAAVLALTKFMCTLSLWMHTPMPCPARGGSAALNNPCANVHPDSDPGQVPASSLQRTTCSCSSRSCRMPPRRQSAPTASSAWAISVSERAPTHAHTSM